MKKIDKSRNSVVAQYVIEEYRKFLKETDGYVQEVKRATVLTLGKLLNLADGDIVSIHPDGSFDIVKKEASMENGSETKTLNGRAVTSEELERQKKIAEKQNGAKLEEVTQNNFRLHLKE